MAEFANAVLEVNQKAVKMDSPTASAVLRGTAREVPRITCSSPAVHRNSASALPKPERSTWEICRMVRSNMARTDQTDAQHAARALRRRIRAGHGDAGVPPHGHHQRNGGVQVRAADGPV